MVDVATGGSSHSKEQVRNVFTVNSWKFRPPPPPQEFGPLVLVCKMNNGKSV